MNELVIWGEPPPRQRRWVDKLAPFLERHGDWGQVAGDFDQRVLKDIRTGYYPIPPGRWEFDHRAAGGRRIHIWARYLGPLED